MKLIIASLTAATVLASAASAMVAPSQIDPRDAAQNALGGVTTGQSVTLDAADYAFDGRSEALIGGESVTITSFATTERPADSSDLR